MAPIISLFNHKGGVSKTTTAFNLGWALADRGKRTLVVDGDPQCELDVEPAIHLPAERSKTAQGRLIPLNRLAVEILRELPQRTRSEFVLAITGDRPLAAMSKNKRRLDALILPHLPDPMPAWRLHDIRRTAATGMQRLGVRLEVIESALGHISGTRGGIARVYQQHRFVPKVRAALVAWGEHAAALVVARGCVGGGGNPLGR